MDLIREGVAYYNTLSEMKKTAVPYFPMGFTNFGDSIVCAGLKEDNKIYLAVWNLKGEQEIIVPIFFSSSVYDFIKDSEFNVPSSFKNFSGMLSITFPFLFRLIYARNKFHQV
jgi:hypothetical protein